jgi:hypothetical protein
VPPQSFKAPETRRLDPSVTNLWDPGFQALEVWNGNQNIFLGQNLGDWMNLMNQGIRRTAVATSDSHEKRTNSGGSRTFIASDVTAPADLWAEAETLAARVVEGRTVGTNAPSSPCVSTRRPPARPRRWRWDIRCSSPPPTEPHSSRSTSRARAGRNSIRSKYT